MYPNRCTVSAIFSSVSGLAGSLSASVGGFTQVTRPTSNVDHKQMQVWNGGGGTPRDMSMRNRLYWCRRAEVLAQATTGCRLESSLRSRGGRGRESLRKGSEGAL